MPPGKLFGCHFSLLLLLLLLLLCIVLSRHGVSAMAWHNPETVSQDHRIELLNPFEFRSLEPKSLMVRFNSTQVSGKLTFSLMGYSERNATKVSKIHLPFTRLASTELPTPVAEEFDVLKLGLQCSGKDEDCNLYDMGFMQISGEEKALKSHPVSLMSPIVPLGWFIDPIFKKASFGDWAFGKCRNWFTSEPIALSEAIAKVSCPTDLTAARSDPGWLLHASYLAGFPRLDENSSLVPEPRQECFYSSIEDVPANFHAAPASMCCYRTSDSGMLQKEFFSASKPSLHGSSVLRSHPFGSDYHMEHFLPGHVPYLSHWFWDIMPYFYCCQWWEGNTCIEMYLKLRPAPQMLKKPADTLSAYVFGSIVQSFSVSVPQAFCSVPGEYWLIRNSAIEMQIRYYVVSEYMGPTLDINSTSAHYSEFRPTGSRSPFATALAVRSMEQPHKIIEIICPEAEYRSYVQVTDRNESRTADYELKAGRGIGNKVVVSDSSVDDLNRVFSILVRHSAGRLGVSAYVVRPGEEFFNLYVTISSELAKLPSLGGLLTEGVHCSAYRVQTVEDRLFSSLCDNCDDFDKYRHGRPLYYVPLESPSLVPAAPIAGCQSGTDCHYIIWSTNYPPYFRSSEQAKTRIEPLMRTAQYPGIEVCQKPNISGLAISENQAFTQSALLTLACLKPFTASKENVNLMCKDSGGRLSFDEPKDFICAKSQEFETKEKTAAAADEDYAKKNYAPPEASLKRAESVKGLFQISTVLMCLCTAKAVLSCQSLLAA